MRGRKLIHPVSRSWEPAQLHVRVAKDSPPIPGRSGRACADCSTPGGTDDVELNDIATGLVASSFYDWSPFCGGLLDIVFTYNTENLDDHEWLGTDPEGMDISCSGSETLTTFSVNLIVTNYLPGGVNAYLSDGTNTWTFTNEVSWQPDQETPLICVAGPPPETCPCSPLKDAPCLIPRETGVV